MTEREMRRILGIIQGEYIRVMGLEKWNNLTEQEQHDVVMILARDLSRSL